MPRSGEEIESKETKITKARFDLGLASNVRTEYLVGASNEIGVRPPTVGAALRRDLGRRLNRRKQR
jgi:hypothetical protein